MSIRRITPDEWFALPDNVATCARCGTDHLLDEPFLYTETGNEIIGAHCLTNEEREIVVAAYPNDPDIRLVSIDHFPTPWKYELDEFSGSDGGSYYVIAANDEFIGEFQDKRIVERIIYYANSNSVLLEACKSAKKELGTSTLAAAELENTITQCESDLSKSNCA